MTIEGFRTLLDTNVLISGIISTKGPPAAMLDLGEAEEIEIVVNRQVLVEADRVFARKFPNLLERYRLFIRSLKPELAEDCTSAMVRQAEKHMNSFDAPILAAAKEAAIDFLVTGNTKHFSTSKVRSFLPVPVLTPREFLEEFGARVSS